MRKIITVGMITLSLALGGCDKSGTATIKGDPVAKVAAPAGKAWVDTVSKTAEGGFLIGNPDAKIKLIEYAATTCSHCAEFEKEAYEPLLTKYVGGGQVNFEVRNFLLNPYDIPLSILTRCSGEGAYLALTQQTFQNQRAILDTATKAPPEKLEAALKLPENQRFVALAGEMGLIEFFKTRGISEDQAKTCLSNTEESKKLIAMTEKATKELKVSGTPSFFLNGQAFEISPGSSVWSQVETKLQEAGAR